LCVHTLVWIQKPITKIRSKKQKERG